MKNKHMKNILIILVITFFIELVIFNISSYSLIFGRYEKKVCNNPEVAYRSSDGDRVFLLFKDINTKVRTFKIDFNSTDNAIEYRVNFKDATSDEFSGNLIKTYTPTYERSKYMPLRLSGDTKELLISIPDDVYLSGALKEISVNEKIPIDFNIIRFIIVFALLIFIYLLKYSEFFNQNYSKSNFKQELVLLGILAVFFILITIIDENSFNPNDRDIYNKDYVEAIVKGQFHLLVEPSEEFKQLDNPYDALGRDDFVRDQDYLWDTVYYNGKQYIYFGILPLLLTFLPYYLITKKFLKVSIVMCLFSVLSFILLKEILLKLLNRYFDKIPFKFVIEFLIILCSGTIIFYINGMSRVYEVVIIAGLYFVLLGIYFILNAIENEKKRYLNIFKASWCLALSVACRPTDLFASLLIVPYLLNLLISNIKIFKQNKKPLLKLIAAVAIPYLTVGSLLMWFNYVRFGNVFEFGAKYQITVVDMRNLGSRFSVIPVGLVANLFSIPLFIPRFPFVYAHNELMTFYGYYYIENLVGGLFFIAPICFFVFYILKANKRTYNKELKILMNTTLIVALFLTIVSIMMGGSNQRYVVDYAWMFVIDAILIFLVLYQSLKSDETKKIFKKILCVITIYTFFIGFNSGIISEKNYFRDYSTNNYYKMRYSICFWE